MGKSNVIVVSAINFFQGGPLTVLNDCLSVLMKNYPDKRIIALVHRKDLVKVPGIELMEFPKSRKSWLFRLYYEYFGFRKLSAELKPALWLSLHDISPNVTAEKRVVYCHNPSPLYHSSLKEMKMDYRFALFNFFYIYLYGINIRKNNWVIVQQQWIRDAFKSKFRINNVVVAFPDKAEGTVEKDPLQNHTPNKVIQFIYPAVPRVFKNFEVIAEAVIKINEAGKKDFEVIFTADGTENKYASWIFEKYKKVPNIRFIGYQTKEGMQDLYNKADAIIFPSKLETWGLPISEAKLYRKPVILADLPYARETLGRYDKAAFFSPEDPSGLAARMIHFLEGSLVFDQTADNKPAAPFARNWHELFNIIIE